MNQIIIRCFGIFLTLISFCVHTFGGTKPNIILIISDDAGYADFGFHDSPVMKTPYLDELARHGMLFQQAYVTAAVCGPSRAGILTGKYQQRFGFEENNVPGIMSQSGATGDDMGLPLDQLTIANYLKDLGYRTMLIGKWHQGNADKFHPLKRGFDEFYGFRGGARSYWPFGSQIPVQRMEDRLERDFGHFEESDKYATDVFADEATAYIERNRDRLFFLILSFNAVHTPMHAEETDLNQIPELTGKRQQLAAMTLSLDRACGRVLDKVTELGLDENTIIIFTNDNGGPTDANESVNDPLSGTKANHLDGGIRVPMLMRWSGVIPANSRYQHPVSTLDFLPTLITAAGGDAMQINGIDGVDLMPYILGKKNERPHEILYWKKDSRAAIRVCD